MMFARKFAKMYPLLEATRSNTADEYSTVIVLSIPFPPPKPMQHHKSCCGIDGDEDDYNPIHDDIEH